MADTHSFRKAFNGFHREDVVRYIEFLNQKNAGIVNQLKAENQALKDQLAALNVPGRETLREKEETISSLQEQLKDMTAQRDAALSQQNSAELEAYRRAERMERCAKDRAEQIYMQATAILAEAATQIDQAAGDFTAVADRIGGQIQELRSAVDQGKSVLQDAAANMYAIRPDSTEE